MSVDSAEDQVQSDQVDEVVETAENAAESTTDTKVRQPEIKGDFDQERIVRDLGKARADTKREAEARKASEARLQAVLKAAGYEEKVDPEKVLSDLQASKAAERRKDIELAVWKAASRKGADPDALLDSRSFLSGLADLDPDNATSVEEAIDNAMASNPRFKKAMDAAVTAATKPVRPVRSSAEFNSGEASKGQLTAEEFSKLSTDDQDKAWREGRMRDVGAPAPVKR